MAPSLGHPSQVSLPGVPALLPELAEDPLGDAGSGSRMGGWRQADIRSPRERRSLAGTLAKTCKELCHLRAQVYRVQAFAQAEREELVVACSRQLDRLTKPAQPCEDARNVVQLQQVRAVRSIAEVRESLRRAAGETELRARLQEQTDAFAMVWKAKQDSQLQALQDRAQRSHLALGAKGLNKAQEKLDRAVVEAERQANADATKAWQDIPRTPSSVLQETSRARAQEDLRSAVEEAEVVCRLEAAAADRTEGPTEAEEVFTTILHRALKEQRTKDLEELETPSQARTSPGGFSRSLSPSANGIRHFSNLARG